MVILQWVGMNALIVYALAACELFPAVLQGFYWRSPENNLVNLYFLFTVAGSGSNVPASGVGLVGIVSSLTRPNMTSRLMAQNG